MYHTYRHCIRYLRLKFVNKSQCSSRTVGAVAHHHYRPIYLVYKVDIDVRAAVAP